MTAIPHDAALVARLRAKDDDAFEALLRTHMPRLLRVARRFLQNEEDARDAVQDAFISAFRSIDRFESGSTLATWLHRIVVNASLMKLRTRRRHPEEEIDDALLPKFAADGHQVEPSTPWSMSAEEMAAQSEMRELVRGCIEQLPETHRVVLIMRDLEEMSTEETAKALGITPAAVKVRLHRARQALRTQIDRCLKEGRRS
ncbi:MAG TPA: sigma-70 family RNA polymerase sigma factor [Thermoanaerobaculia bacterium]|nr:sigma-70 family RNA polymerase sigma factor [Thermoanaerobaculia bacterium]